MEELMTSVDIAHHADNQRRFIAIEEKLAENTALTQELRTDTAELLHMWKDAGIFFKWMRRLGTVIIGLGKIAGALLAIIGAVTGVGVLLHYWPPK